MKCKGERYVYGLDTNLCKLGGLSNSTSVSVA